MYEVYTRTSKRGVYQADLVKDNRIVFSYSGRIEDKEILDKWGELIKIKLDRGEKLPRKSVFCHKWERWIKRNEYLLKPENQVEQSFPGSDIERQFAIQELSILACSLSQELQYNLSLRHYLMCLGQEKGQVEALSIKIEEINDRILKNQSRLSQLLAKERKIDM